MPLRFETVTIDAADPKALAAFWADVFGAGPPSDDGDDEWLVNVPDGPELLFVIDTTPKTTKNRLHLDLRPGDQQAEVDRVVALGATRVDIGQGDQTWVVLADPEGNEFCILRSLTS